jgi:hypothetical protein
MAAARVSATLLAVMPDSKSSITRHSSGVRGSLQLRLSPLVYAAVRRFALIAMAAVLICVTVWSFASWRSPHSEKKMEAGADSTVGADTVLLAPLDARGVSGVLEISKDELVRLMTKTRPLTRDDKVNLDRGCPGFVCMNQRLGETLARGSPRHTCLLAP